MKRLLLLSAVLLCVAAYGQEAENNTVEGFFDWTYDFYGISLKLPEGYSAEKTKVLWSYRPKPLGGLFSVAAISPDRNCVVFYPEVVFKIMSKGQDNIEGRKAFIVRDLKYLTGFMDTDGKFTDPYKTSFNPADYITTISGKTVQEAFNADYVFLYGFDFDPAVLSCPAKGFSIPFDKENYSKLQRVHIVKEGGSNYDLLMLFTKTGFENRWRYLGDLSGTIFFDTKKIRQTWVVAE
ncbi:MAG: hypothetical protein IJK75_00805 [Bacteroidales bacterium]|nr:hypothetical protein [Bacteroidales bacterium]